jgi:hypothetical protein
MLGKVVVVAGAGVAYLLSTRAGQEQYARLLAKSRTLVGGGQAHSAVPTLVDRRPQALESRPSTAPVLLPDATPTEIARAVLAEQPKP